MGVKKNKMYDIGIISFNINTNLSNYGAALHSYAFQKFLNKIHISSVIIDYNRSQLKEIIYSAFRHKPIKNLPFILSCIYKRYIFRRFFKKHCIITQKVYNKTSISEIDCAKRYCCETDVTWSTFKEGFDRAFMCDYPNMKDKNNIAYSIDFGSKKISDNKKVLMKKYSKNFKYISIRNTFRTDEFKSIIERSDISNTIDSVFLLNKEDYNPIINIPKNKKDYVFVYNCKENNKEMVQQAIAFAKKNKLNIKIVNCCDIQKKQYIYKYPTPVSIEKFLGYIKNAKYIFTNSYHGICFSIIFERQFYAFARIGNNHKIKCVLETFGLINRLMESGNNFNIDKIDYNKINKILKERQKQSQLWLQNALKE